MWGNPYGKKLFLPDGIEHIAAQIPDSADIPAERLIYETTVYPLLKPFIARDKGKALFEAMRYGDSNIYNIAGFSHIQTFDRRYLLYCGRCVRENIETHGEPYWHRLHQFPGIFVCPKHGITLTESDVGIADVRNDCRPLLPSTGGAQLDFGPAIIEKMIALGFDAGWLLENADILGYYESTHACYDKWLRVRGYRDHNGKTSRKKLSEALVDYYGQEFLSIFDAYNSGACSWVRKTALNYGGLRQPVYHILLMRFLAGTVNAFFNNADMLTIPEYLPFGKPPYPCRNYLCEYHLQDVITDISVVKYHATPYASFACPYCGFTYRRKGYLPKDRQYSGQIHIEAYGWKWEEQVSGLLSNGISPYKIARDFHCDVRTILDFGVEHKLLLPESLIKRPKYVPVENPRERPDFNAKRETHRRRWSEAIAANPNATRNELRMLESASDQWLHRNDAEWYETNSPPSRKLRPGWVDDEKYAERIEKAVNQIRDAPGKPKRISISAIGKLLGDGKIHRKLASGRLPKSEAVVNAKAESHKDWQRRKILWAIRDMRSRGEVITVYKVRHRATIEDRERKWDEFITQCIVNSE
jgi:hypothetical protein